MAMAMGQNRDSISAKQRVVDRQLELAREIVGLRQEVIAAARALRADGRCLLGSYSKTRRLRDDLFEAVDALDGCVPVEPLRPSSVCAFCFATNPGGAKYRMCCGPGRAFDFGARRG